MSEVLPIESVQQYDRMANPRPSVESDNVISELESLRGQSPPPAPQSRRDSGSTISSSMCITIPPGVYKLPVHGNCPRCHHRHEAAEVKVNITAGYSQASYVRCENCNEKWMALGGVNATCVSLLSVATNEPDQVEVEYRRALIERVRSLGIIASPALSNVPESPSEPPSRNQSIRSPESPKTKLLPRTLSSEPRPARIEVSQWDYPSHQPPDESTRHSDHNSGKQGVLQRLKHLANRFSGLRKLRGLKSELYHEQPTRNSRKQEDGPIISPSTSGRTRLDRSPRLGSSPKATRDRSSIREDHGAIHPSIADTEDLPIKNFSSSKVRAAQNQRMIKAREDFSTWKCRCRENCDRQSTSASPTGPIGTNDNVTSLHDRNSMPQILLREERQEERRQSHDILLIGSHLDTSSIDDVIRARPFSIASTTRLSQAPTAVSSERIPVASPIPVWDANRYAHGLRFPRPHSASLSVSRFPYTAHDELDGQSSIVSYYQDGVPRTSSDAEMQNSFISLTPSVQNTGTTSTDVERPSTGHTQVPEIMTD